MPNDLLNSTICLESLICVAQVPMMEQIMRSLLFLVPGEVIQFWAMAFELACLSEKRDRAVRSGGEVNCHIVLVVPIGVVVMATRDGMHGNMATEH